MKLTTTLSILSTMVLVSCGQSGKGKKSEAPAEDPQPENSPTAPTEAPAAPPAEKDVMPGSVIVRIPLVDGKEDQSQAQIRIDTAKTDAKESAIVDAFEKSQEIATPVQEDELDQSSSSQSWFFRKNHYGYNNYYTPSYYSYGNRYSYHTSYRPSYYNYNTTSYSYYYYPSYSYSSYGYNNSYGYDNNYGNNYNNGFGYNNGY